MSVSTKIGVSILAIAGLTIFLHGLGFFLLILYAGVLWNIWKSFKSVSYLFDRKTLMVYRVETKKQQRHLQEVCHFSELGKFRMVEVQQSESQSTDSPSSWV
jgi:hypothetical protein